MNATLNLDAETYQSQLPDCAAGETGTLTLSGTFTVKSVGEDGAVIELTEPTITKEEPEAEEAAAAPEPPAPPPKPGKKGGPAMKAAMAAAGEDY